MVSIALAAEDQAVIGRLRPVSVECDCRRCKDVRAALFHQCAVKGSFDQGSNSRATPRHAKPADIVFAVLAPDIGNGMRIARIRQRSVARNQRADRFNVFKPLQSRLSGWLHKATRHAP